MSLLATTQKGNQRFPAHRCPQRTGPGVPAWAGSTGHMRPFRSCQVDGLEPPHFWREGEKVWSLVGCRKMGRGVQEKELAERPLHAQTPPQPLPGLPATSLNPLFQPTSQVPLSPHHPPAQRPSIPLPRLNFLLLSQALNTLCPHSFINNIYLWRSFLALAQYYENKED